MIKMKLLIKTLILNFNLKKIVPYPFKTHKMNNSNQIQKLFKIIKRINQIKLFKRISKIFKTP